VRRKPYSVVLFDEIEKAHPDVFNTLLQVLDEGRMTDSKGRTVNFKNTIVIMTSNMGSPLIREQYAKIHDLEHLTPADEAIIEDTKSQVMDMLKQTVRPEFLNRIDEIVMFSPLTEHEIRQVVDIQLASCAKMLAANNVELHVTEAARDFLTRQGYDPEFGARPVKRAIQHHLLNALSRTLLGGSLNREVPITVDAGADGLTFSN
jgi:ATP-dependent Clp protease ATP-binding subunit ClpB